jgi:hypothetical protein
LSKTLPAGSPHVLRGSATVDVQEYRWQGDRIGRVVAAVKAEHAQMSQSLVEAVTSTSGFQCRQVGSGMTVAGEPAMIALDLFALRFQLGREGLTFWGDSSAEAGMQDDCIAQSGGQPLLLAPRYYNWPLGVLVQTLCGRPAAWVPATREAVDMASPLPLPLK